MDTRKICLLLISITVIAAGTILSESSDSVADNENNIAVSCSHGYFIDLNTGEEYIGGPFASEISIKVVPNGGYEFVSWSVEGDATYTTSLGTITITKVSGNVSVSAEVRNYSYSSSLLNTIDISNLAVPGDTLSLKWSFSSTDLDTTKDPWVGTPSVPLIVGDRVYIHAGDYLYCLDSNSGKILKSVSSVILTNQYYYYLGYGNGVIVDTISHKAYDLDLNYLYDVPTALMSAVYYEGYFYGCLKSTSGYQLYRATADPDNGLVDSVKVNLFTDRETYDIWAQYGQFSSFYIKNGWIFFLEAKGNSDSRYLTAFNIETEIHETLDLTSLIGGMLWDDGWLTEYNDYFYLTTYVAGLFDGVKPGFTDKYSSITWVKFDFDKGKFETPQCKEITTPEGSKFQGIASQFVVYKGHGYVNARALGDDTKGGSNDAGTCLISYDIGDGGEPIAKYTCSSAMSHGGLVLNTAHEDEGKLYIYLIPYNPMQRIYVFTDVYDGTEWKLNSESSIFRTDETHNQYCSQAIRVGPNGEIIFYQDTGWIDCYMLQSDFKATVTVSNGDSATVTSGYGTDVADVFKNIYPQAELSDGLVTLGGQKYKIYLLNEVDLRWVNYTDLTVTTYTAQTSDHGSIITHYRHLLLLKDGDSKHFYDQASAEKGWYYYAGGQYEKCVLFDSDSLEKADGHYLIYLSSRPTNEVIKLSKNVDRECLVSLDIEYDPSAEITIGDDTVVTVSFKDGYFLITGLKESSTTVRISTNGSIYEIVVQVGPKRTVDGDKTTIDSHTEENSEGYSVITDTVTTKAGTTESVQKSIVKKDSGGNVVETTLISVETDSCSDYDVGGNPIAKTERKETVKDSGGNVVRDTVLTTESSEQKLENGSLIVIVNTSDYNKLTHVNEVTYDQRTVHGSYTVSEITTELYENDSDTPSKSEYKYAVTDGSEKTACTVTGSAAEIVLKDGEADNISFLLGLISSKATNITVKSDDRIDSAVLEAISKTDASLFIYSGTSEIIMGSETMKNLVGGGDVSFTVSDARGDMTPLQTSAAGDAKVFSIVLKCGESEQHEFGKFTVSIACDLGVQGDKELHIWRIDDSGNKTYVDVKSYADGKVTFEADHLSYYAVGYETVNSESDDSGKADNNTILYAGVGLVAVLIILGLAYYVRSKKHNE